MKIYQSFFILLIISGLTSCGYKVDMPGQQICTLEFRTIVVRFKNTAGNYIVVSNFKATVERIGVALDSNNELGKIDYTVVSDLDKKKLLQNGDDLNVTATNPSNGNAIAAQFKISGGENAILRKFLVLPRSRSIRSILLFFI